MVATVEEVGSQMHMVVYSNIQGGNTPFHLVCHGGFSEVVELLLFKGASCTTQNEVGYTLLHKLML